MFRDVSKTSFCEKKLLVISQRKQAATSEHVEIPVVQKWRTLNWINQPSSIVLFASMLMPLTAMLPRSQISLPAQTGKLKILAQLCFRKLVYSLTQLQRLTIIIIHDLLRKQTECIPYTHAIRMEAEWVVCIMKVYWVLLTICSHVLPWCSSFAIYRDGTLKHRSIGILFLQRLRTY